MSENFQPIIGKNVIENLTIGMYDAPFFIYREYIQNAADAIDLAVNLKLLKQRKDGKITILINKVKKQIIIEDNASGIETKSVQSLLGNIAQSTKDKYADKGFRGIGRLGGLGYCDKLTYETSSKGEPIKSIMVWDAKSLRTFLNDQNSKIDAAQLISIITDFSRTKDDVNSHYFRVTLDDVHTDELLDENVVLKYLSMVAPVSFSPKFTFKTRIYKQAKADGVKIDEYLITLNGDKIYKGYKDQIFEKDKIVDKIIDIEFLKDFFDKELLYWGWYGITEQMQYIPADNNERFIRLRKGNIQIGLESRLDKFHQKDTGNRYFVGEIYAIHKDLSPNGRRDFFIENSEQNAFISKLTDAFKSLYTLFYDFSKKNSAFKVIQKANQIEKKLNTKIKDNANEEEITKLSHQVTEITKKVDDAKQKLISLKNKYQNKALGKIIVESSPVSKLTEQKEKNESIIIGSVSQPIITNFNLSLEESNLISHIYKVIRANKKESGEELIALIDQELGNIFKNRKK